MRPVTPRPFLATATMLLATSVVDARPLLAGPRGAFVEPVIMRDEWLSTFVPFAVVLLLLLVLLRRRVRIPLSLPAILAPVAHTSEVEHAGFAVSAAAPAAPPPRVRIVRIEPEFSFPQRLRCALWIYGPLHLAIIARTVLHDTEPSWRGLAFVILTIMSLPVIAGIATAYALLHALPWRGFTASACYGTIVAMVLVPLAQAVDFSLPPGPAILVGATAGLFAALLVRALVVPRT